MGLAHEKQESSVVGDQMQALEMDRASPPDPAVPWGATQGAGLPQNQSQPMPLLLTHVPQHPFHGTAKTQIVVLAHERIPARTFFRPDGTNDNLGQQRYGSSWRIH